MVERKIKEVELIKPCPCGKIPDKIYAVDNGQGRKWAQAYGNCCGEWSVEFRTEYNEIDSDKCNKLAIEAWNEAPRG